MSNLKTWPEKIWLQAGDDYDGQLPAYHDVRSTGYGVTWCEDSIDDHEVQYIRADLVEAAIEAARAEERERWANLIVVDGRSG